MRIKLRQIREAGQAMGKLIQSELKATTAYKISKSIKVLTDEIKAIEEQRIALINKYGTKGEGSEKLIATTRLDSGEPRNTPQS